MFIPETGLRLKKNNNKNIQTINFLFASWDEKVKELLQLTVLYLDNLMQDDWCASKKAC